MHVGIFTTIEIVTLYHKVWQPGTLLCFAPRIFRMLVSKLHTTHHLCWLVEKSTGIKNDILHQALNQISQQFLPLDQTNSTLTWHHGHANPSYSPFPIIPLMSAIILQGTSPFTTIQLNIPRNPFCTIFETTFDIERSSNFSHNQPNPQIPWIDCTLEVLLGMWKELFHSCIVD